jgi:replicative DNA helicase
MKGLLRSVIDFGGISQVDMISNFQKLMRSHIEWDQPADTRIFEFLKGYFHSSLEMPAPQTIKDYFEARRDEECRERVGDFENHPTHKGTNYTFLLKNTVEEQFRIRAVQYLKEAQEIINKGLVVENEKKQGLREGINHFVKKAHELISYESDAKIEGDIREDGELIKKMYEEAESNKALAWGKFCGLNGIDKVIRGIKKGEMWVHAAFTGELKTSFSLNWAYNLVTRYRSNVLYVTLEMPYEQVSLMIHVMHTSNGKYTDPRSKDYSPCAPLDYDKVKAGTLTAEEKVFYGSVIDDFYNNPEYGRFKLWGPDEDVTTDDIQMYTELKHQEVEVHLLIIDHGGLIEPRKKRRNKDYTVELNSVLRDTKKMALHFNHGEKIPILLLFQINREGKESADKNEGRYKLRHLSYANECLVEGTLVRTNQGLVPIELVNPGSSVWSSTGWKTVLGNLSNGTKSLITVEAVNGLRLTVTRDHLFRTLDPSGLSWTKANGLLGKYLLIDFCGGLTEIEPCRLPELTIAKYEKANGEQGTPLLTPRVMTTDLAYLIGSHDGDGKKDDDYRVGWTGNRLELQVRRSIQDKFLSCFGHPLSVTHSPSRSGSFDLSKWSKPLHRWFTLVGMDRCPSVSPYILCSGSNFQGAYLKGLWDTDGSINNQGNLALGMSSDKVNLLQQVQVMLLGLGVSCYLGQDTQVVEGVPHSRHTIWITSRAAKQRFLEVTGGFTEDHKQQRLQESLLLDRCERQLWPVGFLYLKVYTRYTGKGITKMPKRCRVAAKRATSGDPLVQQRALEDLLDNLIHIQGSKDLDLLRRLLKTTLPVQVVSVTPCGSGPVYDLEVTGDHEYSTGGVLTHNCERSADVITTTYLNDEHRKNGTTMFDCLKRRDGIPFQPFMARIHWGSRRIGDCDQFKGQNDQGMSIDDLRAGQGLGNNMFQGI